MTAGARPSTRAKKAEKTPRAHTTAVAERGRGAIKRKAGWSWGCVSAIDSNGRTIWIADAHRDDGKRFVVRADEKLTAFAELELAIRSCRTPRGLRSA